MKKCDILWLLSRFVSCDTFNYSVTKSVTSSQPNKLRGNVTFCDKCHTLYFDSNVTEFTVWHFWQRNCHICHTSKLWHTQNKCKNVWQYQCCVTFKIVTLVTKKCDKVYKLSYLNLSVTCVTLLNCDISNKFDNDHNIKV